MNTIRISEITLYLLIEIDIIFAYKTVGTQKLEN